MTRPQLSVLAALLCAFVAPLRAQSGNPLGAATTGASAEREAKFVPVLSDNYTKYADTKALLANVSQSLGGTGGRDALYNDGLNGSYLELDRTVLYNGHPTAKYNQPAGTTTTPQIWTYLSSGPLTKAWIRIKVRFSPGFTTTGTTANSANAYKLLGWGWQGTDGRGTIEFTNTDQYTFNWNVTTTDKSRIGAVAVKNGPSVTTEWSDGRWYQYIVYVEQTSPTTVRQRWWMGPDGDTPALRGDITGRMSLGSAPALDRIGLGMNFNSTRPRAQALWFGEWCVVDGSKYENPFGVPL